jgi:hypothetical protein
VRFRLSLSCLSSLNSHRILLLTHATQRHGMASETNPGLTSAYVCEVRPQQPSKALLLHLVTPPSRDVSQRCAAADMLPCRIALVGFATSYMMTYECQASRLNNLSLLPLHLLQMAFHRAAYHELTATGAAGKENSKQFARQ